MCSVFISGMFYLLFSDRSGPEVTETEESRTMGKRGLLYTLFNHLGHRLVYLIAYSPKRMKM
jgi:hypothetical protein